MTQLPDMQKEFGIFAIQPILTSMLKQERQAFIIKQINLHNKVMSSDLSLRLDVSEDTIRRDLNELAENGKIMKVHGGALSKSFQHPFKEGNVYAREAKKKIAKKTLSLIRNETTILTGGGTTILELARLFPENIGCTIFTISAPVALELVERTNADVILIGGKLSRVTNVSTGSHVINQLSEIHVDLCLLGANSLSIQDGVTDSDWEVIQIKKAMLRSSSKTAILAISEKLNSVQNLKVCGLNAISYLVTDLSPGDESLREFRKVMEVI